MQHSSHHVDVYQLSNSGLHASAWYMHSPHHPPSMLLVSRNNAAGGIPDVYVLPVEVHQQVPRH